VDVRDKLDELKKLVENARTMPMSASCVINRNELLAAVAEIQSLLPVQLAEAQELVDNRAAVVEAGRAEAARLVEDGERQRQALVRGTDTYREAEREAEQIRSEAVAEANELRRETDDYVDHKLASFEIALQKTLSSVAQGRERLRSGAAPVVDDTPIGSRRDVDEYVDHRLGRFEHSLSKTLEAVTRGRERLQGRSQLGYSDEVDPNAPPLPGE
jgi:hypothetical protein